MEKLIAFAGRKRSGKTTFAKVANSFYKGSKIYSFASALKKSCANMLDISLFRLDDLKNNNGEVYVDLSSKGNISYLSGLLGVDESSIYGIVKGIKPITTVRELLQKVGTDIIRRIMPEWHINEMRKTIQEDNPTVAIIDDVRFPNEISMIKELGGTVYFVCRPDDFEVSQHPSETSLDILDFNEKDILVNKFSKPLSEGIFRMSLADSLNPDADSLNPTRQDIEMAVPLLQEKKIVARILSSNTPEQVKEHGGILYVERENQQEIIFNPILNEKLKSYICQGKTGK